MAYIFRSQLNQLITVVNEGGLPADRFVFSRDFSKDTLHIDLPLSITFRNSIFHFSIEFIFGSFYVGYLPSVKPQQTEGGQGSLEWDGVRNSFAQWLERVKQEVSQPDPWSLYTQGRLLTGTFPTGDRGAEKINGEELRKLRAQTRLIREFVIRELSPTTRQLEEINQKLDYMEESAQRLNKKDWANVAIGVIFSIAVSLAMDETKARALFGLVGDFIKLISRPLLP